MNRGESTAVVVGGGVVGLTTAVRLLQFDDRARVIVLEQARVGAGASRFAGALDIPYQQSRLHAELVESSWRWFADFAPAVLHRLPVPMTWCVGREREEELRARVGGTLVPAPHDGPWRYDRGEVLLAGKAYVLRGRPWCEELARWLRASGRAEVREGVRVESIVPSQDGVRLCTSGGAVQAARAIICVGPWLPGLGGALAESSAALGIRTKSVFGLQVFLDHGVRAWQATGWPFQDAYVFPRGQTGRYVVSLRHDEWDVSPDDPSPPPEEFLERAAVLLDGLVGPWGWRVAWPRVFMDTYTPGFSPVVETPAGFDGCVTTISGTHGSGIRLSPGLAELAVRSSLLAAGA